MPSCAAFEQEIGRDVTRPAISGLMGAYGAALHAKDNRRDTTTLIGTDILAALRAQRALHAAAVCAKITAI